MNPRNRKNPEEIRNRVPEKKSVSPFVYVLVAFILVGLGGFLYVTFGKKPSQGQKISMTVNPSIAAEMSPQKQR